VLNDARQVLNLLVRNQAPLNVQNAQGETALFIAARQGDFDVVKFLLMAGANPNICNVDEASPLHVALANNNVAVAAALLKSGAHVNARDACGDSALHWAVREGHSEAIQLLLADYRCDQSAVNEDGETPSALALSLNMSDIYNLLRPKKLVAQVGDLRVCRTHCHSTDSPLSQHMAVADDSTTALTFNAPSHAFSEKLKAASMEAERRAARPVQAAK
jgi:ankyrin repeat protein